MLVKPEKAPKTQPAKILGRTPEVSIPRGMMLNCLTAKTIEIIPTVSSTTLFDT
jgi:hypothetical protein